MGKTVGRRTLWVLAALALAVGAAALYAWYTRSAPARCSEGWLTTLTRCCAPGQREREGLCDGTPERCPPGTVLGRGNGCRVPLRAVHIPAGTLDLAPTDWEAQGRVTATRVPVTEFWLDNVEVTVARYEQCVERSECSPVKRELNLEAERPVRGVSPEQAARFCEQAGGALPTGNQWLFAAMGTQGRRFAWGATGLVCRRAVFGLAHGPCAVGGTGPDWPGSRPAGATPEGILDLVGNVAEWTREETGYRARGGSYRARVASELKSWSEELPREYDWVGFRCAYETPPKSGAAD